MPLPIVRYLRAPLLQKHQRAPKQDGEGMRQRVQ